MFFNQETLNAVLGSEVDVKDLKDLSETKVDKEELCQTKTLINNLNERVKHLSNLLNALASSLIPLRTQLMSYDENTK